MSQLTSIGSTFQPNGNAGGSRRKNERGVPYVDLRAQYATIKPEINSAVQRVMGNADSIRGREVECFEWEIAAHYNVGTAIGVSSGTEALQLSLLACGVERNDEVVTAAFGHPIVLDAISGIGATPVFVDVDVITGNLDPIDLEAVITSRTKAIVVTHLYGRPADLGRIMGIAHRCEIKVVENASHAHGARYLDKFAGTIGDIGCFNCGADESLGAYGDAGIIVTNTPALAAQVRRLRDQGERRRYGRFRTRPNSRLDPLQAAVLRVKLRHLDAWNARRMEIADIYRGQLAGTGLRLPPLDGAARHAFAMFVIRTPERDQVQSVLQAEGIGTAIHYPLPLHLTAASRYLNYAIGDFPKSERVSREVLSLPIYPEMEQGQAVRVAQAVKTAVVDLSRVVQASR